MALSRFGEESNTVCRLGSQLAMHRWVLVGAHTKQPRKLDIPVLASLGGDEELRAGSLSELGTKK